MPHLFGSLIDLERETGVTRDPFPRESSGCGGSGADDGPDGLFAAAGGLGNWSTIRDPGRGRRVEPGGGGMREIDVGRGGFWATAAGMLELRGDEVTGV